MKILWFSNYRFSSKDDSRTGTWLGAMGRALVATGQCNLVNVTIAPVDDLTFDESGGVRQWLLPFWKTGCDGMPSVANLAKIKELVDSEKPDLVHVWGLESYYGLLIARGIISGYKTLLDIQGIRFAVGNFFMGNLTLAEQIRCIGVKELLRWSISPIATQKRYLSFLDWEIETIRGFGDISYQSQWSHDYLKTLASPNVKLHRTQRMLRKEFEVGGWSLSSRNDSEPYIFAMCGAAPYKGLHIAVRAFSFLVKSRGSGRNLKMLIGGGMGRTDYFRSGYLKFVQSEIKRLGLVANVAFLGPLNAGQMREYFLGASAFLHPSFIESYSLVVAESMSMGVPSVISYAGAMPELAVDGESALYYPSGDAVLCAERICRILDSDELAQKLSRNARDIAIKRNSHDKGVQRQLEIYHDVLGN